MLKLLVEYTEYLMWDIICLFDKPRVCKRQKKQLGESCSETVILLQFRLVTLDVPTANWLGNNI